MEDLAKQLLMQAGGTVKDFFTKPTFQSPVPQTQGQTPFQQVTNNAKDELLKRHMLGNIPEWVKKFSPSDTPVPSLMPAKSPTPSPTIAPTATPTTMPTPTPTQTPSVGAPKSVQGVDQSFVDILNNKILPITRQYDIPDAVVAAQAGAESGHGKSDIHRDYNNYFSLKFGGKMHHYENIENGVRDYALTIKNMVPNLEQLKNNPLAVMQAMQGHKTGNFEGDNTNPMQYVYDVSHTPEWQAYGGGQPLAVNPWGQ